MLSNKNDPDVIKIAKSKFDINKIYLDVVEKFLSKKSLSDAQKREIIIRNDEADYFVTRGSLERLKPGRWLNDEILNAYVKLVNRRQLNKAYAMNTFFFTMLENMHANQNYNYSKLERIIKK